ncbi:MAG: DUF1934 domain-containing protein [Ruminiclostridium sp.]|nr:DUF1934 domain-containing protein [Ruminiclostridium sp.]
MKEGTILKKDVMITVDSKQEHPEQEPEVMNFITEGTYSKKDNCYCITYDESPVTGLDGTTTTMEIASDSVTLIRYGNVSSLMVFEKGRKHTSEYNTEYGIFAVGVTARKLNVELNDHGGHFDIEYVLEVNNQVTSFTTLNIKVQ